MEKQNPKQLEELLRQVLQIERAYAFELKNVKAERRGRILELVEQFASKRPNQ